MEDRDYKYQLIYNKFNLLYRVFFFMLQKSHKFPHIYHSQTYVLNKFESN